MEPKEGAAVGSPGSSSIKKGAGVGTGAGVAFEFFNDLLDFAATTGEGRVVLAPLVDLAAKTEAMERLPRKIIALVEIFMMIFAERMNWGNRSNNIMLRLGSYLSLHFIRTTPY